MAFPIVPPPPRVPWRGLALLAAGAAALRLPALGASSFWLDEGFEAASAAVPFGRAVLFETNHPPLHRALLWLWTHLAGDGDAALRTFPAILGALTAPALFLLADRAAGRRAAWLAGGLAVVSPYLVDFSRELRGYALLILLAALSCSAWLAWTRDDAPRARAGWTVAAVAGLLTHYFFAFVLLAQAADGLLRPDRRRRLREAALPVLAIVALTLPWAAHVATHLEPQDRSYVTTPLANVAATLFRFSAGYGLWVLDSSVAALPPAEQARQALPVAALALLIVGPPFVLGVRAALRDRLRGGRLLLLVLGLPVALLAATSPVLPLLHDRYLAFAAPAFLVLVAIGLAALPRRLLVPAAAALAALSLVADARTLLDPACRKEDWRGVAALVRKERRPGDLLVLAPDYLRFGLDRYDAPATPRATAEEATSSTIAAPRVWLVTRLHDPAGERVRVLLDRRLRHVRQWRFPTHWGLRVDLLERPPVPLEDPR